MARLTRQFDPTRIQTSTSSDSQKACIHSDFALESCRRHCTGQYIELQNNFVRVQCLFYLAEVFANVRKGKEGQGALVIGRVPLMLRSCRCVLSRKTESELAKLGECPLDPGGYFVVKGTEKVMLRLVTVAHWNVMASVPSSTHERKSKKNVIVKHERLILRHNSFADEAMGVESDQEIVQMVGRDPKFAGLLSPSMQECASLGVYTQQQALEYLGSKDLFKRMNGGSEEDD